MLLHGVSAADLVNKIFIYKEMVHLLSGEFGRRGTQQLTYFQIQSRSIDSDLALHQG